VVLFTTRRITGRISQIDKSSHIFPASLGGLRPASSEYQPPIVGALGYPWFLDFPWPYSTYTHGVCFDHLVQDGPSTFLKNPDSISQNPTKIGMVQMIIVFDKVFHKTSSLTWFFFNLCHAYGLSTHRFRMISVSKSHDFMGLLMFIVYFRWLFPCHKTMVSFYEAKINPVTPRLRTSRQGLQAEVGTKLTILRGEWRGKVRSHESSNDCHVIYWREITNDMIIKVVYKIGYTNSIIQFNLILWTHTHIWAKIIVIFHWPEIRPFGG
jgi:hypothetical protein